MVNLLFLPHCLRKDISVMISESGEAKKYDVYVIPGGSQLKKIVEKYERNHQTIEKIVGVACDDEIKLATEYFGKKGYSGALYSIPLSQDGCADTLVDMKKVIDSL